MQTKNLDTMLGGQFVAMFLETLDGVPREVPGIDYADLTVTRGPVQCEPGFYQGVETTQEIPAETMFHVVSQAVAS